MTVPRLIAQGLFLLAFTVYLTSIAPTVYWRDAPEFVVATHLLGVAHPAGAPTYTLVAKPLTFLPFGSIAFRVNLASCLFGALTVSLSFSILWQLLPASFPSLRLVSAFSGALFLLASESLWRYASVAEVYTLQDGLLVILIMLLLKAWAIRTEVLPYALYWLGAFLYGLSGGVHASMAFFAPAFLAFIVLTRPRMLHGKNLAFLTFFLLLGLAVYLYLPLRSLGDPALDWGDTESFRQFLNHITDRKDASSHFAFPWSLMPNQLWHYLTNLTNEFAVLGLLFGLMGCIAVIRQDRAVGSLLCLVFLGNVGFFVRSWRSAFGFLPSFIIFAIWIGFGIYTGFVLLSTLYQRYPIRISRPVVLAFVATSIVLTLGQTFFRRLPLTRQSANYSAELYGKELLAQLPPDSILFAEYSQFPLLYLQQVERRRPDLTVLLQGEVLFPWYFSFLSQKRFPNIALLTSTQSVGMTPLEYMQALLRLNQQKHPFFWEIANHSLTALVAPNLRPQGFAAAFIPEQEIRLTPQMFRNHRGLLTGSLQRILQGEYDFEAEEFFSTKINQLGLFFQHRGLGTEAAEMYQLAIRTAPQRVDPWINYGVYLMTQGRLQEAAAHFDRAFALEPAHVGLNTNLGLLFLNKGNANSAVYFFDRARLFGPPSLKVSTGLGAAYLKLGRFADAANALETALALRLPGTSPNDPEEQMLLGVTYVQLSVAYMKLQRFGEAKQALQSTLKIYEDIATRQDVHTSVRILLSWAREHIQALDEGKLSDRQFSLPTGWTNR